MRRYDAVVVGGGPAGSSCARALVLAGLRVLVLDRADFPRVKLCAGWLSDPVWDVLGIAPSQYRGGLWEWNKCHVRYRGTSHHIRAHGHFIRRYEFDDFLLQRSGADIANHNVKRLTRDAGEWIVDDLFAARYLIGAGGTHCPVARQLFPAKAERPVGVQELELQADATQIAATRIGDDGEPELLLHDDLRGYAWNVPKTDWLNVGCGTLSAQAVRAAWTQARADFAGTLPAAAARELEHAKGHSYYLYHPGNIARIAADDAFIVGDAVGLSQPLTAEGILPALLSGRLCGEAIADGAPDSYAQRLARHPIIRDYDLIYRARERAGELAGAQLRGDGASNSTGKQGAARLSNWAIARGFAWMFSGRPLPAGRAISGALRAWHSIGLGRRAPGPRDPEQRSTP